MRCWSCQQLKSWHFFLCASHITPGLYVLVPSCFEQNSYGIALGLGLSHMTPYDFFLLHRFLNVSHLSGEQWCCMGCVFTLVVKPGIMKFCPSELKFTLNVKANPLKLYRDLDQIVLHLWSIFGDPGLNGSQVITRTSSGLTPWHMDTLIDTDTGNNNTQRPKTYLA